MVKKWHDVVSNCGENPRRLLAAAIQECGNKFVACQFFGDKFARGMTICGTECNFDI